VAITDSQLVKINLEHLRAEMYKEMTDTLQSYLKICTGLVKVQGESLKTYKYLNEENENIISGLDAKVLKLKKKNKLIAWVFTGIGAGAVLLLK